MKRLIISKDLNVIASKVKGVIEIDDAYISNIEKRIDKYLTLYGDLPLIELRYGFIQGTGITMIDIKVLDEVIPSWKKASN